jgi:perosamine synthetase
MTKIFSKLAIDGGAPVRSLPMPVRYAVGPDEKRMIEAVLDYYAGTGADFCYQGHFEELYIKAFTEFMGGGYADAVATGTLSLLAALAALELPKGSEVLVSPITDPGSLSAIIYNGLVPRLVDSAQNSYNIDVHQVEKRISPKTGAIMVVHSVGQAADIDAITRLCQAKGIKVLEDCSQSHGARFEGRLVGTFGDIAAFSTMYRKNSITGACGGVVYTRDEDVYHKALAYADRGKPRWLDDFDDRDPTQFLFPALNLHTDDLSCGIGVASLKRLPDTIHRRLAFVEEVSALINTNSETCAAASWSKNDSPFIYPVFVDSERIKFTKREFAEAVRAEGIGLNPHYMYVVRDWPWIRPYLADDFDTVNARDARDRSFNLYLNEKYSSVEAYDTLEAILKVENSFKR